MQIEIDNRAVTLVRRTLTSEAIRLHAEAQYDRGSCMEASAYVCDQEEALLNGVIDTLEDAP